MVVDEWEMLGNMGLPEKLKNIKIPLRKWNSNVFGNIDKRIKGSSGYDRNKFGEQ